MGDNTIDNLSIQISGSASKAVAAINSVASSFSRVKGAAKDAASNGLKPVKDEMEDVAASSKEAGKEANNFGKEAKNAGNSAKQGASGIERFLTAIKRVMFYRVVRSVLRSIANAFKEGISNLYQWSAAVNGSFAKSMDRIATSTLYLKNSLGAMLAPIIERLAPVLEWIIDRIVDVINWINKLFAALSGSQTYTVAKKVATKWAETEQKVADSASSSLDKVKENAQETVKELKKTILAFDEINKMEKQDEPSSPGGSSYGGGGGSGGGSSTPGTDYTNMFETRKLDGWMSKLAAFIAKFKAGVPALLGGILAAWLAIKAAIKKAVEWLKEFWEKLKEIAGKVLYIPIRLIKWGWNSLKEWLLGAGKAVVTVGVVLATSAKKLWEDFKLEWQKAGVKIFTVGVAMLTSAKTLWENFKEAWQKAGAKVFAVSVAITTTAKALWEDFKSAWAKAGVKVLAVSVAVTTTAKAVWNEFKTAWAQAGAKVLAVGIGLTTSAKQLWTDFKKAWAQAGVKVLTVGISITTTAKTIWDNFKKAWAKAPAKVLSVALMISTAAKTLFEKIKTSWASVPNKVLGIDVKPEFAADGNTAGVQGQTWYEKAWNWIQSHWKVIAAAGLGVAVAVTLATGAPALAGMVSGLWAKAVALLGGGLAISVAPSFAGDMDFANATYGGHEKNIVRKGDVLGRYGGGTGGGGQTSGSGLGRNKSGDTTGISEVVATVQGYENTIKQTWVNIINNTATSWTQVQGQVMQALTNIGNGISAKFATYVAIVSEGWKNITNVTATSWTQIQGQVMQALTNLGVGIDAKYKAFSQRADTGWNSIVVVTNKKWHDVQSQVMTALTNLEKGIRIRFSSMVNIASSFDWGAIGRNIVNGISSGLNWGWAWLNDMVWNLAISLYNTACWALGIHSPSKLFSEGVGEMIDKGIVSGIEGSKGDVLSSIASMSTDMAARLTSPGATASFSAVGDVVGALSGSTADNYMLAEYVRSGVQDATHQQNELLREQNNILRQLLDKPVTAEISTNGIINGLIRKNQRDGTTIVPVNG